MDEPLIYTTLGNMPESALEYRHLWEETKESITFTEQYWHEGELVRESRHLRLKEGIGAIGESGKF